MPNYDEHMKKYNENKEILTKELDIGNGKYYNWIVTISFYAAMHLIEGQLAKSHIDSKNHKLRQNNVERFNVFKPIRVQYKILYDRSIVARYEPAFMTKDKSKLALKCLHEIEKELNNYN